MSFLIAVGAWFFWPAAAGVFAWSCRAMCEAVAERRAKPEPRPVHFIFVEPEQPRTIHVRTAEGVVVLRPSAEPVIHSDGSDWR